MFCTGLCYHQRDGANGTLLDASTVSEAGNVTEQVLDEERENDRRLMEEWTKMFFSMGRVPQQGTQVLIFPGLFSKLQLVNGVKCTRDNHQSLYPDGSTTVEVARPRELRSFTGEAITNISSILPAYSFVDDQVAKGVVANSSTTMTNFTTQSFIQLSNDSRLFVDGELYHFEDVESLDEDQRQRRRLRSARNEMNLLSADHEHISTMITTVFSTARNYINNQTVRANVVRYLTSKMRSFGLVTGNQIFHPEEFSELVSRRFKPKLSII